MNKKGQLFPWADTAKRKSFPYITLAFIAANIAIFLYSLTNFEFIIKSYGFVPASPFLLTIFTSMFLHGGFDHVLGNMWYLWIFGDNVEDKFGRVGFIIFYFFAGVAATLMHLLTNLKSNVPAIGASGAISGVLGAYVVLFPKAKVFVGGMYGIIPISAYFMIGLWFLLQLFFGVASLFGGKGSGIAFWAHIGGFVFGVVVTLALLAIGVVRKK